MSEIQTAIARLHSIAKAGFPKCPTTQPEIHKQLQRFTENVGDAEPPEELLPFLRRAQATGASSLRRGDVNRVLRGAWHHPDFDEFGEETVKRAETETRRSSDQAIIAGYLVHFPVDRPVIAPLAAAARRAADRHPWAWRERSERWSLFDPAEGPLAVGNGIAGAPVEPASLLSEIGLGTSLAATNFGRESFIAACVNIGRLVGGAAQEPQRRLLSLFESEQQASDLAFLVQALLEPWISSKPEEEHRKILSEFLVDQIGDPRVMPQRWKHITETIAKSVGPERASAIVQVLKRWLTDVAMREFFKAIAKTTDRPDQWRQRSEFWLAYLDAGLVTDAWPALGIRARRRIEEIMRESGERPEYGIINGGPPASSSIIMQIGDLRISEWSDNGSCRFWGDDNKKAPKLYAKSYDGSALRTTYAGTGFEYYSHVPSHGWEGKFAGVIHRRTGISHPRLGRGRGRHWGDTW